MNKNKAKTINKFILVSWENAPEFMKINPFVTECYRPRFSIYLCFQSLFRIHNETLNVWTHLLSALLFGYLLILSQNWFWHDSFIDVFFINLYGISCIIIFIISSCYHLFSCNSQETMKLFARLDFAGITIGIISSLLPGIYSSLSCYPTLKWINISIVLVFLVVSSTFLMIPKYSNIEYKKTRNTIFTIMGFYGLIPMGLWIYLKGWNSEEVQIYFWKMSIAYLLGIIGSLFYITRIPERFYPGKLTSVWLQSHTFWHLFASAGSLWLFKTGWDYYLYSNGGTNC